MKVPNLHNTPSQLISEPSQTDLKFMDDNQDYPSQANLEMYMHQPTESARDENQSTGERPSAKNPNLQNKISKKKTLTKENKVISSVNGMPIRRTQSSQVKNSSANYTKIYSKKSSEFREVKFSEFELIYKTFNMFSSQFITFNELILGLKSLGVEIQTQKKFQTIKNIYDELVGRNDVGIDFEGFGKIVIKFLKQQKAKTGSDYSHLEKGFYYMIQEANKIRWPFDQQEESEHSPKELFDEFKLYVDRLSTEKKYLTKDSLTNLAKYLGIQTQITQNDIENIVKYGDREEKGYLSFEDVIRCIQGNKIVQN